jgi:hypothetical protein
MPRHSIPAQRLRLPGRLPLCRHLRPTRLATAAPARRARIRRTLVALGVVVATPATPLRPLLPPPTPTPGCPPPDRPTSTRGRGTSPYTLVRFRAVSSARRPSWSRPATTQLRDRHPGSSSRPRISPRHQPTGHLGLVRAGTSSRWRTPSTPWRLLHHPLPRTGWLTPAPRITPPHQLVISHTPVLWHLPVLHPSL